MRRTQFADYMTLSNKTRLILWQIPKRPSCVGDVSHVRFLAVAGQYEYKSA